VLTPFLAACSAKEAPVAKLAPLTNSAPVSAVWTKHIGSSTKVNFSKLTPVIDDQRAIIVDSHGDVIIAQLRDGTTVWSIRLPVAASAGAANSNDAIFVPTTNGKLYALNSKNGTELWHIDLPDQANTPPTYSKGRVFVKTIDDQLVVLDAATGQKQWDYDEGATQLQLMGSSRPIVAGNMVFAGFSDGKMNAYSASTGQLLWQTMVAVPRGFSDLGRMVGIFADPVVVGNIVYVASYHGTISALNAATGEIIWQRPLSSYAGLAVDNDAVFVSDSGGRIWAFSQRTGAVLWKQTTLRGRHITAPAVIGNTLVVADNEGNVHWLSQQDGHFVARTKLTSGSITSTPQVQGDVVLLRADNGNVAAYAKIN
jgi:outer membrane protein assembly factor BamB